MEEDSKEHNFSIQGIKKIKSGTSFSNTLPTYVVAYSLHGMYDDFLTAQQMICSRRSPDDSVNSICPSISSKSNDGIVDKREYIIDIPQNETDIKVGGNNGQPIQENANDSNDEILIDKSIHELDNQSRDMNEFCQMDYYFEGNKFFNTGEKGNKIIGMLSRKKQKKYNHIKNIKKNNFKYKIPEKNKAKCLGKFYHKVSNQIKPMPKDIYLDFISQIISETQVVKKVSAKENLLESISDGSNFNEKDTASLGSPSTVKKTYSCTSDNTLVLKISSSREDDFFSIKNTNSVIEVASEKITPFKTDVINVAVAVSCNQNTNQFQKVEKNLNETLLLKENLTSTESLIKTIGNLTSEPPSNEESDILVKEDIGGSLNDKGSSNKTLTGDNSSSLQFTDDDTFILAKTSSDFNREDNSDCTLTTDSENLIHSLNLRANGNDFNNNSEPYYKINVRDTILDIGMFPEIAPSTSSGFKYNRDTQIINDYTGYSLNLNSKGDVMPAENLNELSKNVLKKQFGKVDEASPHKHINLPNTDILKTMLKEHEKAQNKTCSRESQNNCPINVPEMWDRLLLVLDLTVQKLEETLADKIVKELKKYLIFTNETHPIPKTHFLESKQPKPEDNELTTNEHTTDITMKRTEEPTQCELVSSMVIDKFMTRLSGEGPQVSIPESVQKLLKPKALKDYFEVLKAPAKHPIRVIADKGDTITVSTTTIDEENTEQVKFRRLKLLFAVPYHFLRENIFVLTGVPTFFVALICMYGLIFLIAKVL
ncbi:hypothetical protein K1T71_013932 [Dendrolimus kikuchii]|uniref:Uncharacterized protein n=1 Tax=Dendrolimus kikuchii TaxID=765133 RepID=A0ACC1CG61_9NEOP|nr:hypothetical protein K1T71_013932 [Dendrolimus kikuchii]